jgi:hypothetical protein
METSTKIAIGVGALIVIGGGITAYILLNKKSSVGGATGGGSDIKDIQGASPATNSLIQQAVDNGNVVIEDTPQKTPTQQAYTPPKTQSGCSQVRYDYDKTYNYKKCDGVWFTMKKNLMSSKWASLADPKWATAVANLNAKYPND